MHHNSVVLTKMKQIELFFQASIFSLSARATSPAGRNHLPECSDRHSPVDGNLRLSARQTFLRAGIFAWVLGQTFLRAGKVAWVLGQVFQKWGIVNIFASTNIFVKVSLSARATIHKLVNPCLTARQPFTKLWTFAWVLGRLSQSCESLSECSAAIHKLVNHRLSARGYFHKIENHFGIAKTYIINLLDTSTRSTLPLGKATTKLLSLTVHNFFFFSWIFTCQREKPQVL